MLIIPITGKISWKNPPFVTLAFVLINILIYLVWQSDDHELLYKAHTYYFESGLAKIELSQYLAYQLGEPELETSDPTDMDQKAMARLYREMESDSNFKQRLLANLIITEQDPVFSKWRELRTHYAAIMAGVVSYTYGFRPAQNNFLTAFSYMFLHGSFGHLFGNMIFLWLVGCMLEMGGGRLFSVVVYFVTGLCAAILFWLFNINSTIPLVGASGAIAGFMGAFAVMYGKTRVKIFYSLGFYFNYVRFPAIVLFPIWLGSEIYQLSFGAQSNVAYMAHIGGLLSGAGLGYANRRYLGIGHQEILEEEPVDSISPLLEKALQHIGELDMEGGRKLLVEALSKDPNHGDALLHLFNVDKLQPESKRFHQTTKQLLHNLCIQKSKHKKALQVYEEYSRLAKPPRLSPELYLRVGNVLTGQGKVREAEQILGLLLKKKPDLPGLATGVFQLAGACQTRGEKGKWERNLKIVCKRFPESEEARLARPMLKNFGK